MDPGRDSAPPTWWATRHGPWAASPRRPLAERKQARSNRVAELGAAAVLCLSFPLHPPGRPEKLRAAELALVTDADRVLAVVQGERDPFGGPEEVATYLPGLGGGGQHLYVVPGTHTIPESSAALVEQAVTAFASTLG